MKQSTRDIEYVAPTSEAIRAYARRCCEALAAQTNDPVFMQPHVIGGFASFLEIAARAMAKHLNSQQLVDSDEKSG